MVLSYIQEKNKHYFGRDAKLGFFSRSTKRSWLEKKPVVMLAADGRLGYYDLREHQLNAAKKFLQGNDVFVSLPTGNGKSLIYAVLPFAFDHLRSSEGSIVVVISPLLSQMKDQVALQASVVNGEFQLLLIGPELLLLNPLWRAMVRVPVYIEKLVAFAIDEAHCIAQWGDNFRQEFSNLGGEIRCLIPPSINLLALTAAATVTTKKKIHCILGMKDPSCHHCHVTRQGQYVLLGEEL
ncbi:hypothetical protein EMCRGX_G024274 [Ephydatia muelleri]